MEAGALGISTGLGYSPGRFADAVEVTGLLRVASEYDGVYAAHIRDEGAYEREAVDEAIRLGRTGGVRLHISHLKISGPAQWGSAARLVSTLQAAIKGGMQITIDQYPYTASSASLELLLPEDAVDRQRLALLLHNKSRHMAIVSEMEKRLKKNGWSDYSFAKIASCASHPEFSGRSLAELAATARQPSSLRHGEEKQRRLHRQTEFALQLYRCCDPQMVYNDMDEGDLRTIMAFPRATVGSDSGVRKTSIGRPHPRGWGTFPRILGRFTRDEKLLDLRQAIFRMTALPAQIFAIPERGYIKRGFWADVVVFDAVAVRDTATYENPFSRPEGIRYVIVNGKVVVNDGQITRQLPGKAIRRDQTRFSRGMDVAHYGYGSRVE